MKEVKMGRGRSRVRFLEEGREWKLPCFLYADDLILCGNDGKCVGKEVCKPMVAGCEDLYNK